MAFKIRFAGFETRIREKSLASYFDTAEAILDAVRALFTQFQGDRRKVRLVGVRVSRLKRSAVEQRGLQPWL